MLEEKRKGKRAAKKSKKTRSEEGDFQAATKSFISQKRRRRLVRNPHTNEQEEEEEAEKKSKVESEIEGRSEGDHEQGPKTGAKSQGDERSSACVVRLR